MLAHVPQHGLGPFDQSAGLGVDEEELLLDPYGAYVHAQAPLPALHRRQVACP